MRILVWCAARGIPLYGPSGASVHLRGIGRALLARGHDVRMATLCADDARGRWDDAPPLPALHLGNGPWPRGLRTFGARWDGHRLALRAFGRPDLLWERHEPASRAADRWAAITGTARWVEVNAPLSWERRWPAAPAAAQLARERRTLSGAERILAVSAWLAQWLRDLGLPPERIRHVPNGVEPQDLADPEPIRRALDLRGPVVGFLGSGHRWHGLERLPAILDALGPSWTGVVVGGGAAPSHPRLRIVGHLRSELVPGHVAAFHVGIAPAPRDAPPWFCPLKILAYRAQGVPVVATDRGDARALVGDGGLCLDTDDPHAWARAIRDAADRPRTRWLRTWQDVLDDAGLPHAGHEWAPVRR